MAYLMLQTGAINGAILLIFFVGLGLFSYSIYSGKRLLTDTEKGTGIILSIINQILQLFQWSMLGYGLSYSSGAEIAFGLQEQTFKFNLSAIVSTFKMSINSDNEFSIKINLIAVLLIFVLTDIMRELRNKNDNQGGDERSSQINGLIAE